MRLPSRLIALLVTVHFCLLSPISYAKFPRGCESVGYEYLGDHVKLQPVQQDESSLQTLFLFRNNSRQTINIQNKVDKEMVVAPVWNVRLNPNNWAAFATSKSFITFNCQKLRRKGQKTPLKCQDVLEICQYPRAKFSISTYGTYWITSNKTLHQTVRKTIKKRYFTALVSSAPSVLGSRWILANQGCGALRAALTLRLVVSDLWSF